MDQLTVGSIVGNGVSRGLRNVGVIFANAILWALTIWIPYLNVGTTIGLTVGLVAKSGRGEPISATEIFNPVYRKRMGDYFLVMGLVSAGTGIAAALLVVPAIVIGIAWSLAALLTVDKGFNPTAAITESNNRTYGRKWTLFVGMLVLGIIVMVIVWVLALIGSLAGETMTVILSVVGAALGASILVCGGGFIYQTLAGDVQER